MRIFFMQNIILICFEWKMSGTFEILPACQYLIYCYFLLGSLLFEDQESGLFTVTLFRKAIDDFRLKARENK